MKKLPKKPSLKQSFIVDTPWLKLIREDVRFPGGTVIKDFFIVERPTYAAVIPLLPNGDVLLVKQYRHGPKRKILNVPMGVIGKGEKPIQAAKRELQEETGYLAKDIIPIGIFENNPAFLRLTCYLFFARRLEKRPAKHIDKKEHTTSAIFPLKKAIAKVSKGEIRDMTTVIGLLAAEKYLEGKNMI